MYDDDIIPEDASVETVTVPSLVKGLRVWFDVFCRHGNVPEQDYHRLDPQAFAHWLFLRTADTETLERMQAVQPDIYDKLGAELSPDTPELLAEEAGISTAAAQRCFAVAQKRATPAVFNLWPFVAFGLIPNEHKLRAFTLMGLFRYQDDRAVTLSCHAEVEILTRLVDADVYSMIIGNTYHLATQAAGKTIDGLYKSTAGDKPGHSTPGMVSPTTLARLYALVDAEPDGDMKRKLQALVSFIYGLFPPELPASIVADAKAKRATAGNV